MPTEKQAAVKVSVKSPDILYSAKELAKNAEGIFAGKVRSECVAAALKTNNVKETTIKNAKKLVESFLKKEVI